MIVIGHLSTPPNHGLDRRLYGLRGVGNLPGRGQIADSLMVCGGYGFHGV